MSVDADLRQGDRRLIAAARFAFAPFGNPPVVGLAVSGGSDSLAMLHLIAQVAPEMGSKVHAITIDHGLRAEAADEAAFVGRICASLGVAHSTVKWEHAEIFGNLMDRARRARYALMADWARTQGIGHVAVAHTMDDQAETVLMGLARAAGIDGLSGMRSTWREDGITFTRPFLAVSRADLQAYLLRKGIAWIDDPSNADGRFQRIKARRALAALAPVGITAERLARVASNLDFARSALAAYTAEIAADLVTEVAAGLQIRRKQYSLQSFEVQRRLLITALQWVSGAAYAPRANAVGNVELAIVAGKDSTLSGCRIRLKADTIAITREPRAVATTTCPSDQLWDGRWRVTGPHAPDLTLRALGAEGLRMCKKWRDTGHSRDTVLVSPAVWRGDALISAPLAGFNAEWSATIPNGFHKFVLSH